MEFIKISLILLLVIVVVVTSCGPESGTKHGKRPQSVRIGADSCVEAILSYNLEVFCNNTTLCPSTSCLNACSYVRENMCSDETEDP